MPAPERSPSTSNLTRRIAGLWMVVLAVGLALVGVVLAIFQARSFTQGLIAQSQAQAQQLADRASDLFERQLADGLGLFARPMPLRGRPASDLGALLPSWFEGVYAWDGHDLSVVAAPAASTPGTADQLRGLLPAPSPPDSPPYATPELAYVDPASPSAVFGWINTTDTSGDPLILATRIRTERVRTDLLDPLVSTYEGLEVKPAGRTGPLWHQPLFGAMRFWIISPTEAFAREQRSTILSQTFFHIGVTSLAVATLLVAMWALARVVRREMALAEMKANFVANVSHELKTPLALIRMFGETLQSGRVNSEEKRQEYYSIITRESTRLTNLIDNILNFARVGAGRKEYQLVPTDVAAVIRDTFEAYRDQLAHDGFEHHLTVDADLPRVSADRDAIAQALINLVNNAVKYSDSERYIAVDVTNDTRRGKRGVLISVHDRGIGIRPEDRARVVEGFFRASDGRVREQGGTGLGLALVKHIVDGHRGSLDIESRLVKGSTFRIFLPGSQRDDHPASSGEGIVGGS